MAKVVKPVKSGKSKKEIVLGSEDTVIYQSNRVTEGKFKGFTLLQGKILACVINELQQSIKLNMEGNTSQQLSMFEETEANIFKVSIPMNMIGTFRQYNDIQKSAMEMLNLVAEMKVVGKAKEFVAFVLFHKVGVPTIKGKNKALNLFMTREAANYLIEVNKKFDGSPKEFTTYRLNVALNAKTKYSQKLYWIISSWKNRGGFVTDLKDLRDQLGLEAHEYPNYADFKRRILLPSQNELKANADYWFNCAAKDFEIKDKSTKKVQRLNFKIIQKADRENAVQQYDYVKNILKAHAGFQESHLQQLSSVFEADIVPDELSGKVVELIQYVKDPSNKVASPQAYIIKSLSNKFA